MSFHVKTTRNLHNFHKMNALTSGFSFVELIITVAVLIIVVGGGIAAFFRFNETQSVLAAGKELQTILRSAQTKARVRETPPDCDPALGLPLQAWRVTAPANVPGATVQMYASCGRVGENNEIDVVRGTVREYTLPSSIMITTSNGDLDVRFWALYGGTQFVGTNDTSRDVRLEGNSKIWQFTIRVGGDLTEGAFL